MALPLSTILLGSPVDPNHRVDAVRLLDKLQDMERANGDVRAYGAVGTPDDAATVKIAAADGFVFFPREDGADTTYTLLGYTAGDFDGAAFATAPGVSLNMSYGLTGGVTGNVEFVNDVTLNATIEKTTYVAPPSPKDWRKESLPMPSVANFRRQRRLDPATEMTGRSVAWPGGDVFGAVTTTVSGTGNGASVTTTGATGEWRGVFFDFGPFETITGRVENATTFGSVGVIIRGTGGYAVVFGSADNAVYVNARKLTGFAAEQVNVSWAALGQGAYINYAPRRGAWSVSRIGGQRATVSINGQFLCEALNVGDILEVGFVAFDNTVAANFTGLTVERRTDMQFGKPEIAKLWVFGDSTAEKQAGGWTSYMRQLLDGLAGVRLGAVENRAVGGDLTANVLADMTAAAAQFSGAPYIVVCAGANDIQAQTTLATFEGQVQDICDLATASGSKIIWIIPWQFYTQLVGQTVAGVIGRGQNTTNYELGANHRGIIRSVVLSSGGMVVDPGFELPQPNPSLILLDPQSPLLRDNIHQDQKAYQLYAMMVAQAIADDYLALPGKMQTRCDPLDFEAVASGAEFRLSMDKPGKVTMIGTIAITSTASGTILTLPKWSRPEVFVNIACHTFGSAMGSAYLSIGTNGVIQQNAVPVGATQLIINATFDAAI